MSDFYSKFEEDVEKFLLHRKVPDTRLSRAEPILTLLNPEEGEYSDVFWVEYTPGDPVHFFFSAVEEPFREHGANIGIRFPEETPLIEIAVIDTLYGMLCTYAMTTENRDLYFCPVPELHLEIAGQNGKDTYKMILFVLSVLQECIANILNYNLLAIAKFEQAVGVHPDALIDYYTGLLSVFCSFIQVELSGQIYCVPSMLDAGDTFEKLNGWYRLEHLLHEFDPAFKPVIDESPFYEVSITGLIHSIELFTNLFDDEANKISADIIDWNISIYT